jgi:protein-S-isoprenylcysteine O-methyltransferase Ste14
LVLFDHLVDRALRAEELSMTVTDTPGVIAPPPLIFLAFLVAAFGLDSVWPLPLHSPALDPRPSWLVGAVLILAGLVTITLGIRNFTRAGTPVPTRAPTRALVTTGIHGRSRNPIYVSMSLIYAGIGLLANTAWIFVLLVPIALVIRYGVVAREEAYLERKFGNAYRAYKSRVRRWF